MSFRGENEYNYMTTKLSKDTYNYKIKPNPGLNLKNLENIPKAMKKMTLKSDNNMHKISSKLNLSIKTPHNMANDNFFSSEFKNSKDSFLDKCKSLNPSDIILNKQKSKQKYSSVQSPTSNIFNSSRCHKYHTDLDFNYLTNQKFLKDAVSCGKDKLSTVSLKSTSPDKYFYEKKESPHNLNRYSKSLGKYNALYTNSQIQEMEGDNQRALDDENFNNTDKKSSHGILSEILDLQFSISSPSKLKIFQNEMDLIKNEEFKKNILNLYKNPDDKSLMKNPNDIYQDDDNRLGINLSFMGENPDERFIDGLENVLTYLDPIYEGLSLHERIEKFLEATEDQRRSVRLGSIVALYLILRKFKIDDSSKLLILEKTILLMQNFESQEELFLVACLELCSLFAPHELLLENITLICMFITDFNFPTLQKASFNCLMSMEYDGVKTLVELASKDYQEYQKYILNRLLQTPHIQKIIIIKALLNEIYSNNPDRRHSALAALNRMHDLVGDTDALSKLSKFFQDTKIEKLFLSSTIRTAGGDGEKVLLNEIRTNKDFSVRVAIASVLAYRTPKIPKYLKLRLDNNDTYSLTKNLPGSFCTYIGKVSPYVYENEDEDDSLQINNSNEYLEVNTRDFLASLQRMLIMNYDHSNPQLIHHGSFNILETLNFNKSQSDIIKKYTTYFELNNANNSIEEINEQGKILISDEVIRALCHCLRDYSTAVRDTAASTLGQIGLPESLIAIDYLIGAINDEDVNVKSKVIWAIGRISAGCENSVIIPIVEALRSNMWKVKCTCLFALSQFGSRSARMALPVLNKLLKDTAINKQAIAETMVKLGTEGESTLLKLMNSENDSNYKLKSCIAKSLALANINSTNIDFIVECLFKSAKSNSSIIRKNAIFAIRVLADKAEERVTYLKRKNVIPFYYEKMLDKDSTIQAYAISCIKSLGAQGELIFIEGLTKDINPTIRQNCAIGLAEMGPHSLRTLLISLHDENYQVRKIVEKEILEKFSVDNILNSFGPEKSSQRMSLKIAIRDILEKDLNSNPQLRNFFQSLLIGFEKENIENDNKNSQDLNKNDKELFSEQNNSSSKYYEKNDRKIYNPYSFNEN